MLGAQAEELLDAGDQAVAIVLPDDKRQVGAQGVVAQRTGPAQLLTDGGGIEGLGLPHLGPIDRGAGQIVEAQQPGLLVIPGVGLLDRPLLYRHRNLSLKLILIS
ncbi:hypothetical protein D3C72_532110 [compost metagenome]